MYATLVSSKTLDVNFKLCVRYLLSRLQLGFTINSTSKMTIKNALTLHTLQSPLLLEKWPF